MKSKSAILIVIAVLIAAGAFALKNILLFTKITSTPILAYSNNALWKVSENGKAIKMCDVDKDSFINWVDSTLDKKKTVFITRKQGSPDSSLWCIDMETLNKIKLAEGPLGDVHITTNNKVIFTGGSTFSVWTADIDGKNKINLAEGLATAVAGQGLSIVEGPFVFSKDGKWVIFVANDPKLNKDCYFSAKIDGSKRVNLTGDLDTTLTVTETVSGRFYDELIAFSDDGNKILFSFAYNGKEFLYITSLDGSNKAMLPYGYFVSFVNDGNKIIFLREAPTTDGRSIWKVSTDGKIQKNLTEDMKGDCYGAMLSPSGDRILFEFAPEGSQEYSLWLMNIDGGEKKNLTEGMNGAVPVGSYTFSLLPKGDKVLFLFQPENSQGKSLWVASLYSSQRTKLMEESEWDYYLEYVSPSGDNLLIRSENSLWFVSTDGTIKERLNGEFGSNMYSIINDILLYKDSQDNSLYMLNLTNDTRLMIKESFTDQPAGNCQISDNGNDILICSSTKEGYTKYYLFNIKNRKLTDLNEIVKGDVYVVNFFP